ncbi:MAG: universal stress protein [Nitrospirae bacterium]|nr:universal stress protein [Nitrospirota bacterium]
MSKKSSMGKLRRTMKSIETAMMAASFAEEGDADSAREVLKEERGVLLAIRREQMDKKTFRYAVNTCKRTGARLDIIYISPAESSDPLLEECLAELRSEGVNYRLMHKKGCLKKEIIDYTNNKKDIIFAVTESADSLDVDCTGKGKMLSEAWQNLKCPLVVVTDPV